MTTPEIKRILLVTDAWSPQINGVVTTLKQTIKHLENAYVTCKVIEPSMFKTKTLPQYPEIKLVINPWRIVKYIKKFNPTHIHIATEGPIGLTAVVYCRLNGWKYTTSYHTNFGQYIEKMAKIPQKYTDWYFNWFHNNASYVFVPSRDARDNLPHKKKDHVIVWGRGVDCDVFNPKLRRQSLNKLHDVLCVSRVSVEKNLRVFLDMKLPNNYNKVLVGDGPLWTELHSEYTDTNIFMVGMKMGNELAKYYANADVFIFPSLTDTFGVVILEALSTGTPVISYKTAGALDVIEHGVNGFLLDQHEKFEDYVIPATKLDRSKIIELASKYTWSACTKTFSTYLVPIR